MHGLQQMDDLAKLIPGLSLGAREPGGTTIVFRGVASSGLQFGAVSSSALYLDEQPITQSGRNPDPRMIDIERIEALRGPQGTLYGASSQSGTLRVITAKPDAGAFSGWFESQVSEMHEGSSSYDISAMLNVPLAADRLALRLVGFTAEDGGFIDNVLSDSQGGTFDNAGVAKKDVNSKRTSGGRAALRFGRSRRMSMPRWGPFSRTPRADGQANVDRGVGDLHQVRFEKESLDDKWYQLALTFNASLPFGDAVLSASYFDRDFRYEADATAYEYQFNQRDLLQLGDLRFRRRPARLRNQPRIDATSRRSRRGCSLPAIRIAAGAGWPAPSTARRRGHTDFDSYVRDYQDTPAFAYFSDYEVNLSGSPLAPTEHWFLGRYDTELDQVAVFGELGFDVTENFTITAGGRWFDYERKFIQHQESPEGFSGATLLNGDQKTGESGTVAKLNLTYKFDRRPADLRDLLGGIPRRRQQPAETRIDPAAGLQLRRAAEPRDRREDRVAEQSAAHQPRGLLHEME